MGDQGPYSQAGIYPTTVQNLLHDRPRPTGNSNSDPYSDPDRCASPIPFHRDSAEMVDATPQGQQRSASTSMATPILSRPGSGVTTRKKAPLNYKEMVDGPGRKRDRQPQTHETRRAIPSVGSEVCLGKGQEAMGRICSWTQSQE